jgi:hypothetical protein
VNAKLTDTKEVVFHQILNAQLKTELCEENPSFKRPERPIMLGVSHEAIYELAIFYPAGLLAFFTA